MFVIVRAIIYATIFVSLVLVLLPAQLLSAAGLSRPETTGVAQVIGLVVLILGMTLALWCVAVFAILGKGTPAPFDPPRKLVVRGPYRFVRNPMYIGAGMALSGAALYFRSVEILWYFFGLVIVVFLFIVFYEEPTLRRMFGEEYEEYCRKVRRMLPRWPND